MAARPHPGRSGGACPARRHDEERRWQEARGRETEAARSRGDRRVNLSAQRSAEAFYRRLGYRVEGEPFDEVGIEHVHMTLALAN